MSIGLSQPVAAADPDAASRVPDEFAPMPDLFDRVGTRFPGRILMVELARTPSASGPARYDVKVLTDDGNVLELSYDARTLDLERVEGGGDNVARKDYEVEYETELKADENDRDDDRGGDDRDDDDGDDDRDDDDGDDDRDDDDDSDDRDDDDDNRDDDDDNRDDDDRDNSGPGSGDDNDGGDDSSGSGSGGSGSGSGGNSGPGGGSDDGDSSGSGSGSGSDD